MNHREPNSNRRKVLFVVYSNGLEEMSYPEVYRNLRGVLTEEEVYKTMNRLVKGNLVTTRRDYSKGISYVKILKSRIKVTEDLLRESRLI